ncbi:DNA polymerase III subunit gamma and tau [Brachybacterium huguangmaarense]
MATALYRRYRPESFADVIGQDHVTVPLMRALRNGRIGHAYLFSGPRGCGKTTSARILARCLNCAEGPTDTPCGVCDSCRDLARGGPGSLDVVEIDAASHGGVDDARELRERATFAPARDRFKVFIIDEAHMVTSAGFNALLKLVEEPPEHVKFVFATTEPDKVIGTIRSRTHHYPFRLIPPQVLTPYLQQICETEGVRVGEGVLPLVVRAGGGSARDTLSVLDQLMAGAGEDGIDQPTAIALLGFTDTALLDSAIGAISRRDAGAMYGAVEQVISSGQEPRRFVEDLLERLRDLIVLSAVPERGEDLLPQMPADALSAMRDQIEGFDPADLSRCGDLVHETLSTMSGATSPRLHLELLAARLVLRDQRTEAAAVPAGPSAPQAAASPRGQAPVPGRADGPVGGAGSGRDRARQIAQEQADAARRTRESERSAPEQPAAGAPPESRGRQDGPERPGGAPAQDPRGGAPRSEASTPPAADDGWGPVAPLGGDRAAPMHGGVAPHEAPARSEERSAAPAPQDAASEDAAPPAPAEAPAPEPVAAPTPASAPTGGTGEGLDLATVREHWSGIVDELQQIRRPSWALISQNAHPHAVSGSTLTLGFRTEGLLTAFRRGTAPQNTADAVRRVLRADVTVEGVVAEDPGDGGHGVHGGPSGGGPGAQRGPGPDGAGRGGPGRDAPGHGGPAQDGPAGSGSPQSGGGPARDAGASPSRGQDRPGAPRGERDRGPSRGSGVVGRPAVADDLPPEPDDDPYPPDDYPPDPQGWDAPEPRGRVIPERERDADVVPEAELRPGADPAGDPFAGAEGAPRASVASSVADGAGAPDDAADRDDADLSPIVIPDDSRDSVPSDEPRTHGQEALRRALAEGRPVRTEPRTPADAGAVAEQGPDPAALSEAGDVARETEAQTQSEPDPGPRNDLQPMTGVDPATSRDGAPSSTPASAPPAAAGPANQAPPGGAPANPSSSRGAALAREAALRSREAAAQGRGPGRPGATAAARGAGGPAEAPEDPTGGASRDDEDAQVTSRRPQEIIETMLGGTVLEIIDERG